MRARHRAFDANKNEEVSFEELCGNFNLKKEWVKSYFPSEPTQEMIALWEEDKANFNGMAEDIKAKYIELDKEEKELPYLGFEWRLEFFTDCDLDKDGKLDENEWKAYYKKIEERC